MNQLSRRIALSRTQASVAFSSFATLSRMQVLQVTRMQHFQVQSQCIICSCARGEFMCRRQHLAMP